MSAPPDGRGEQGELVTARRELAAARALLASGVRPPATEHLARAERLLGPPPVVEPASHQASEPSGPRVREPDASRERPARRLRRLGRLLRDRELAAAGAGPRARRLLRWWGLAAAATIALALAAAHGIWHLRTGAEPWRAAYWGNPTLTGEPLAIRHHRDLHLAWGAGSPGLDIPRDGFSARIDTCLELDGPARAAFLLVAQDDARLFIDGSLAVDDSGEHRRRVRGAELELAAGVHHLRVDYRHLAGGASLALLGSLDGAPPAALSPDRLHAPGDDPARPCR